MNTVVNRYFSSQDANVSKGLADGGTATTLGLENGETVQIRVRGDCMSGLEDGRRIEIIRRRFYLPGDVVVVRGADRLRIHRFLGYVPSRGGLVVLTQADDCSQSDPAALATRVIGRARCNVSPRQRLEAFAGFLRAIVRRVRP